MERTRFGGATVTWAILSAATGLSWLLGHDQGSRRFASIAVMVIAMLKIRLVLMRFMELRDAPLAWRLVFEAWMALLLLALVMLYLSPASMLGGAR